MRRLLCALLLSAGVSFGIVGCGDQAGPPANGRAPESRLSHLEKESAHPTASTSAPVVGQQFGGMMAGAAIADFGKAVIVDHPSDASQQEREGFNTEAYDHQVENPFVAVNQHPLSTFSIDVDTASYANVRRFLQSGQLPPKGAVRIEELLNYFSYDYPQPEGDVPFSSNIEIAECPWKPAHRLARIGLKGKEIAVDKRPVSNLVFLIDVSGSMHAQNKLPLVVQGFKLLVNQLTENDRVAIVVYAGAAGTVLDSTTGDRKDVILAALDRLQAGGSTNGAGGIRQAYEVAQQHFIKGGTNRVILCSDGDFNVGTTSQDELVRLIEDKAKSGVFLTVLGFGMGNFKDSTMEKLADKGNGNYGYIDSLNEAKKIFVEQMSGTLITIAKDVKIQIEFNPAQVAGYRLIGYENRILAKEDFNNDQKDAGEIGAGHTVTALYEIVPAGQPIPSAGNVDTLKYQTPAATTPAATESNELLTLKLRYKAPDGDTSQLVSFPVTDSGKKFSQASPDFVWAAAVAQFGLLLRDSTHKGNATMASVLEMAQSSRGADKQGYRTEFLELVNAATRLLPAKEIARSE
jgi:Ca-activated chloride channel family protein